MDKLFTPEDEQYENWRKSHPRPNNRSTTSFKEFIEIAIILEEEHISIECLKAVLEYPDARRNLVNRIARLRCYVDLL